jgi:aryl-alcohol dehydrogenase-like predicted oxidoreductase
VAVVCYAPLGRGFLTGRLKSPDDFPEGDIRRFLPRFSKENFPKNLKVVEAFEEMAQSKGVNASSLALAWLLAQGDNIVPIPGTTKIKNLEVNIQALSITLTPEENIKIQVVIQSAGVAGARYHAA